MIEKRQGFFYSVKLLWNLSKKRVIFSAICTMAEYLEWVFYSAFFMKFVIDSIQNQLPFKQLLFYVLITIAVFSLVRFFYSYYYEVVIPLTDSLIYKKLYIRLYEKASDMELECFENTEFYNTYSLAVTDASTNLTDQVTRTFASIWGAIAVIIVFGVMFSIDHYAAIFVLSPIIGNFVFKTKENKLIVDITNKQSHSVRIINYIDRVLYLTDYAKEIRLSKIFELLKKKYNEAVQEQKKIALSKALKLQFLYWMRVMFTFTFIFQGVLIYGVIRAGIYKTMSLANLAILSSVMVSATWILIGFTENLMESHKKSILFKNVEKLLKYKPKIPESYDGIDAGNELMSIEFRNVSFSYDKTKPIINNLSFKIKKHQAIALVGHNGAGKTTIIKLLLRMYDPDSGEILVNGHNIKEYNLHSYRALYAAAFQDYQLFGMSVRENVLMKQAEHTAEETVIVENALKVAGIWEKVSSLPQGMETILTKEFDDDGIVLSGGQQQKIVIARAFAKKSPVRIFDEPSSALDPIAEAELYNSIITGAKTKTMIFISHRLSSVKNADEVFMLENGTIIEKGSHKELMSLNGAYADMFTKQACRYLAEGEFNENE